MRKLGAALSAGFTAALLLAGTAVPVPTEVAADANFQEARLIHILGMKVQDPNAQELGVVQDLILNLRAGRVEYVIVNSSTVLGLGARTRAVPAQQLSAATVIRGTLSASLLKAEWEKVPAFPGETEALAHPLAKATDPTGDSRPSPLGRANLQSGRDLLGKAVFDAQLQKLGAVTDLLVDLSGHKTPVALVCSRRFLHRDLRCAVPLPQMGLAGDKLVLATSGSHLEQAPYFTKRAWQTTTRLQGPRVLRVAGSTQR